MSFGVERYEPRTTPVHDLDPRLKLVTTFILIFGVVLIPRGAFPAYPFLWALIASVGVIAHIGAGRLARLGAVALPFALAAATLMFTTPGQPLVTLLGLTITDAGVLRFVEIALKSWLSVQVALLLTMTTPFTEIVRALGWMRVPPPLIAILSFTYRYLFTLKDEAERMLRARDSRSGAAVGHKSGGRLLWRARITGSMVGSLFLRSYERSERVYAAMLSRGFNGFNGVMKAPAISPPITWRNAAGAGVIVLPLIMIHAAAWLWWR